MFETDVSDDQALAADFGADLVIASDGLNSCPYPLRQTYQPDIDTRLCRFVWLGTGKPSTPSLSRSRRPSTAGFRRMPTVTTARRRLHRGTPEPVWKAADLDQMEQADAVAFCERLFAKHLDGHLR